MHQLSPFFYESLQVDVFGNAVFNFILEMLTTRPKLGILPCYAPISFELAHCMSAPL